MSREMNLGDRTAENKCRGGEKRQNERNGVQLYKETQIGILLLNTASLIHHALQYERARPVSQGMCIARLQDNALNKNNCSLVVFE